MNRTNPSNAQAILDSLLKDIPDPTPILTFFCESIIHAHAVSPSGWGITLQPDRIRLIVGNLVVATIHQNALWITLLKENVSPAERKILDQSDSWKWDHAHYKQIPADTGFCIAPSDEARLWETLRPLHNAFIEAASQKWSQLHMRSKKAHSPGVLQALETLTGVNPPQPTFEIPELEAELEEWLSEIPAFDPANIVEGKELTMANIVRRRGQSDFRRKLLKIYNSKCVISGCSVECTLNAAHIIPYNGARTNHPANGLLLRTDLHTLFDLGLITILTPEMSVRMDSSLRGTEYEQYNGLRLPRPDKAVNRPNEEALAEHRRNRGLLRSTAPIQSQPS